MRWARIIFVVFAFAALSFLGVKIVKASVGNIELNTTTSESYRCFASSHRLKDQNFHLLVTCRNLIYPAGDFIFSYVMWATPSAGGNAVKLGELGLGVAEFKTKTAFSNLFVTTEQDTRARAPSGPVVMRGNVQPFTFLDRPVTPTPSPEGEKAEIEELEMPDTETLSTREKLLQGLRRAGLAALLAIVGIIGLVFVLTRPRR